MPIERKLSAGEWMRENGHHWGARSYPLHGKDAKKNTGVAVRKKRGKKVLSGFQGGTIRGFVDDNRAHTGSECIFVPGSLTGRPASVDFMGKTISAARYMALLTFGTPKSEGMVVRHLCGNGHLSCVNPNHLAWGTPGDNFADAVQHRAIGECATEHDRLNAVTPNR